MTWWRFIFAPIVSRELKRGQACFALKQWQKSLECGQRAVWWNPGSVEAHLLRGQALQELKQHAEAHDAFQTVLKLRHDHALALRSRGEEALELKRYDEALVDLNAALEIEPQDARTRFDRGVAFNLVKRYEESVADLTETLRLDPNHVDAYRERGHSLTWLGRWEEAASDYSEMLRFKPEDPDLWGDKAMACLHFSAYPEAFDALEKAIRLSPAPSDHYRQRGRLWWWQNNYDAALDDCEHALQLDPQNARAHNLEGLLLDRLGQPEAAIACFDRALQLKPKNSRFLVNRAKARHVSGDCPAALADCQAALAIDCSYGEAWREVASLHQESGEHRLAAEAWTEAIRLLPKERQLYRMRAQSLEELQEYQQADADYEAATLDDATASNMDASDMNTISNSRILPLLRTHFEPLPLGELALTQRQLSRRIRPDLQRAVESWVAAEGRELKHFSGIRGAYNNEGLSIADLLGANSQGGPAMAVPPEYDDLHIGEEDPVRCVKLGLWLVDRGGERCAIVLSLGILHVRLQIATPPGEAGERLAADFVRTLEEAARAARAYRGKVLSLEIEEEYDRQSAGIRVHRLRRVSREEIILPDRTLELLERNVIRFAAQRHLLRERGLTIKKGLLFYGPPGTGKTHTIHYLTQSMAGHTTLLISASEVGALAEYMTLARMLQPAIVVIEDVDLIARSRATLRGSVEETLLNRLLNEMDGLREDAEIIFILTTNHPEQLEEALASRPGRIDQAIEFPLPDDEGRARLAKLYAGGQPLSDDVLQEIGRRTPGVSASFIKELLRRAAQFHLERDGAGPLLRDDIDDALEELLVAGGALNAKLLGGAGAPKVKGFSD